MITDEIKQFVNVKLGKLLAHGGYKHEGLKWSKDWCGVLLRGYRGHPQVFHGVFRDIEKSVKRRFNKRITLFVRPVLTQEATASRSNSWYWYNDIWAKGQKRCWGC